MPGATRIRSPDDNPRADSPAGADFSRPAPSDRSWRAALRVALIYTLVSAAWIALSDQVLARLIPDPQAYTVAQTFKGWGFVAASAVIIFALVRRELGAQRRAVSAGRVAEARMRQAADQVYTMVHSTPLAIVILGADGKVGLWNPGAERIFGWSAEEVIGRELPFVPEDKRAEYERNFGRVLAGESLSGVEAVRRRKDGTTATLRLWTTPLRDEDGRITATFAMFEDVSARSEAEEMLRRRDSRAGRRRRRSRGPAAGRPLAGMHGQRPAAPGRSDGRQPRLSVRGARRPGRPPGGQPALRVVRGGDRATDRQSRAAEHPAPRQPARALGGHAGTGRGGARATPRTSRTPSRSS